MGFNVAVSYIAKVSWYGNLAMTLPNSLMGLFNWRIATGGAFIPLFLLLVI